MTENDQEALSSSSTGMSAAAERDAYAQMECSSVSCCSTSEEPEIMQAEEDEEANDNESISSMDSSDSMSPSDDEMMMMDEDFPEDPSTPIMSEDTRKASQFRSSLYSKLNRQGLARPMHEGDDEGRPSFTNSRRRSRKQKQDLAALVENEMRTRPRFVVSRCWLCMFANSKTAKNISTFIASHAATMDPAIMAQQIKAVVLKTYPRARGIGRRHILRHIREHMLAPNVRVASMLRSLLSLAETLRASLQQSEPVMMQDGHFTCSEVVAVDKNSTELYLKTMQQVLAVYKTDQSKLMFQEPLPGQPSSAAKQNCSEQQ